MLIAEPMRQKLRIDMVDPRLTVSNALKEDPKRPIPYSERALPNLLKERILTPDANIVASNVDITLPN
jgi:hypothetical protein